MGFRTATFKKSPRSLSANDLTVCFAGHESGECAQAHGIATLQTTRRSS
ncbi:MAG: hypothetical protein J6A23_07150 [Thermoguttaceae bacterium]|nr:hypothetical protein [Thermoguttaceae bacterium]